MKKRKPAKEVLSNYTTQELMSIITDELKAVGIKYNIDETTQQPSNFIPLNLNDTIMEEENENQH